MYFQTSSGPLQSIANFFHNIGPKKKNAKRADGEFTLPDIDQTGNSLTAGNRSTITSPRPPSSPRTASNSSRQMRTKIKQPEKKWTCAELK